MEAVKFVVFSLLVVLSITFGIFAVSNLFVNNNHTIVIEDAGRVSEITGVNKLDVYYFSFSKEWRVSVNVLTSFAGKLTIIEDGKDLGKVIDKVKRRLEQVNAVEAN